MDLVVLTSGGLDSTLVALMAHQRGLDVGPLFIDYGQIAKEKELEACLRSMRKHDLPAPDIVDLSGYGAKLPSGLTDRSTDIFLDAFLPGRNALLLLTAASYGYRHGSTSVAIGLLDEDSSVFPDQTDKFLTSMEATLSTALGVSLDILRPLGHMNKMQVLDLAKDYGVNDTWSCHSDGYRPCGICIACREFENT